MQTQIIRPDSLVKASVVNETSGNVNPEIMTKRYISNISLNSQLKSTNPILFPCKGRFHPHCKSNSPCSGAILKPLYLCFSGSIQGGTPLFSVYMSWSCTKLTVCYCCFCVWVLFSTVSCFFFIFAMVRVVVSLSIITCSISRYCSNCC